ncbi:MAG: VWA domain-containing protein [Flavobacteriaceae bacterium]|jgi:Ca-activated chloride channel family protein|nr:MAG: VWA domain-containing protein [Flavobacteriales bacterium]|tara:strand:+ start:991 stop:2034 length:1044 start_codon:yes stop_codon:yes gene_type:complete
MYQLDEISFIYLGLIIPVLFLVFLIFRRWQKKSIRKYFDINTIKFLSPEISNSKPLLKFIIISIALLMLVISLVNPKIGTELKTVKREGVDIVFAIDVSKSMLAEDIAPNRIIKSKRIVSELFNNLGSDRVGIIAYASTAIPVLPITTDFSSARMFLESLNTDMLSSQGTSIAEAINLSKNYFNDENQTNRVLCVISDGEDHEIQNNNLSDIARESGITIISIGVGSPNGAPIPIKENDIVKSYKKDDKGEVVITKLNENILKDMAIQTGGIYFKGDNTSSVVSSIVEELKEMDKQEFESKQFVSFKDQFQWFLFVGLFLIILDVVVFERKTYWLDKLNLFNENEKV